MHVLAWWGSLSLQMICKHLGIVKYWIVDSLTVSFSVLYHHQMKTLLSSLSWKPWHKVKNGRELQFFGKRWQVGTSCNLLPTGIEYKPVFGQFLIILSQMWSTLRPPRLVSFQLSANALLATSKNQNGSVTSIASAVWMNNSYVFTDSQTRTVGSWPEAGESLVDVSSSVSTRISRLCLAWHRFWKVLGYCCFHHSCCVSAWVWKVQGHEAFDNTVVVQGSDKDQHMLSKPLNERKEPNPSCFVQP